MFRPAPLLALMVTACGGDDGGPPTEAGCDGTPYRPFVETVSFADLPMLRPDVSTTLFPDVYLTLTFGDRFLSGKPTAISDGDHSYCPILEDEFTATLDGVAGSITRGGWVCAGPGGMACTTPSVKFQGAIHAPNAQIVVADSKQTLTMPLGDALVQRTMERLDQSDWTLQVGQPVSIRWSPSTDLAELRVTVSFQLANVSPAEGWFLDPAGITITNGDTINFTVPDDDRMGPGRLFVSVQGIRTSPTHTVQLSPQIIQDAMYVP